MTSIASDFCNATSRKMIAGSSMVQRRDRIRRGVEFLRLDAHGGERHHDELADAVLVVDHEGARRRRSEMLGAAGASVMSSPLSVGRNQLRSSPNNLDIGILSIARNELGSVGLLHRSAASVKIRLGAADDCASRKSTATSRRNGSIPPQRAEKPRHRTDLSCPHERSDRRAEIATAARPDHWLRGRMSCWRTETALCSSYQDLAGAPASFIVCCRISLTAAGKFQRSGWRRRNAGASS